MLETCERDREREREKRKRGPEKNQMLLLIVEVMLEAESWKALVEKSKQMSLVVGWR